MRYPSSLRNRFALLVGMLSWLLGALIGQDSSTRLREEIGHDLAEVAFQMGDRLDRDMAGRAAVMQLLSQLGALRQPDDTGAIRRLLDQLHSELSAVAWVGFTDP